MIYTFHYNFPYPRNRKKKGGISIIIQQRCRLARIRLETFYLQLEVPNLRVSISQIGFEPIIVLLQSRSDSRRFAVLRAQKKFDCNFVPMNKRREKRTSEMYVDAEREGGICTSAGVKGADVELGGGSLATLVRDGAMIGDKDGVCADCGAGAVEERVGPGPGPGEPEIGKEVDEAAAEETAPVSRETSLSETALPVKNSPAVREGSIEGAGGKMSDWNESDFFFWYW